MFCQTCRTFKPAFDRAWSACRYHSSLRRLIHAFKYQQQTGLRQLFIHLFLSFLNHYHIPMVAYDFLFPIPLAAARQRERGYNQAYLLAEGLCLATGIPVALSNMGRCRNTKSQIYLSIKERWTNINGAFTIKYPLTVKHKRILLIDDLLTSGATCSEAAVVLKCAGARQVDALTLAIAPEHHENSQILRA